MPILLYIITVNYSLAIARDRAFLSSAIYFQLNNSSAQLVAVSRYHKSARNAWRKSTTESRVKNDPNIMNSVHLMSKRMIFAQRMRHLNHDTMNRPKPRRMEHYLFIWHAKFVENSKRVSDEHQWCDSGSGVRVVNGMNVNGHNVKWLVSDLSFPLLLQLNRLA